MNRPTPAEPPMPAEPAPARAADAAPPADASAVDARVRLILDVALNRHLGLVLERTDAGASRAWFDVGPPHIGVGTANAGVLYALMDSVAMLALVTQLPASRHAVTHDLHVSVIRPVPAGSRCRLAGEVVRLGRSIAFVDVTATVNGQVVATARVTKSLVAA